MLVIGGVGQSVAVITGAGNHHETAPEVIPDSKAIP
jgi:hypothetical protein